MRNDDDKETQIHLGDLRDALCSPSTASAFDGESQFAKLDGASIHYKSYGKGPEAWF